MKLKIKYLNLDTIPYNSHKEVNCYNCEHLGPITKTKFRCNAKVQDIGIEYLDHGTCETYNPFSMKKL